MKDLIQSSLLIIFLAGISITGSAQFEGPAGTLGTSAMHKDSSDFIDWAIGCTLELGYKDISDQALGFVTFGTPISATGYPDGQVVSLGDSGVATITFTVPITNGPGNDFAIFENSFSATFLELAFVEVSSDGVNYYRFPATSNIPISPQIGPFDATSDATLLNNLAGKYAANYGTPFDLEELNGIFGLDLQNITHLRIIDVVGSVSSSFSTQDQFGNYINDPFPTPFASGGFDLDGVGVINQQPAGSISIEDQTQIIIFPNPVGHGQAVLVQSSEEFTQGVLYSMSGKQIASWTTSSHVFQSLASGVYLISLISESTKVTQKLIVR